METKCLFCGKSFTPFRNKKVYCSSKCSKKHYKIKNKIKINKQRNEKRKITGKEERARDAYTYFQRTGKTMKEFRREYYLNNKDRIRNKIKSYEEKNKEHLVEKKKEYYLRNKEHSKKVQFVWNDRKRFGGNKQLALERDNWQCQDCGLNNVQHIVIYGVGLHIHHIDGNKLNNDLSNFKTLCVKCHRKTFDVSKNAVGGRVE